MGKNEMSEADKLKEAKENTMSQNYKIYCKKELYEIIKEHLRSGMEITHSNPVNDDLICLTVIPKKKRGRKKQIFLEIEEIKKEHNAGTPVLEIAKKAGCTERYIWKLLKEERDRQHAK